MFTCPLLSRFVDFAGFDFLIIYFGANYRRL